MRNVKTRSRLQHANLVQTRCLPKTEQTPHDFIPQLPLVVAAFEVVASLTVACFDG